MMGPHYIELPSVQAAEEERLESMEQSFRYPAAHSNVIQFLF